MATVPDFPSIVKKGDYEQVKEALERVTNRIDKVAMINIPSASGSTPLFGCCWDGRIDLVELLVKHGAKINWKNLRGNTALSMAIECDHVDIVEFLVNNGAICEIREVHDIRTKTGKKISTRIDELISTAQQQQEIVSANTANSSALMAAIVANKIEDVSNLLKPVAPIITHNSKTRAVERFQPPNKYKDEINQLDAQGQTLIFHAAARGFNEIVAILLRHGADLNFRDTQGRSALHYAIANNHYSTVKSLLEAGANTTGVDMRHIRFWSMCNISNRIDNLLKKYPPKPLKISKLKRSPIEGLTYREYELQKKIFAYFDTNRDGYISEAELRSKLAAASAASSSSSSTSSSSASKGPHFDVRLIKQMIRVANSYDNSTGVSFEQFVEILQPPKGQPRLQRRHSLDL